MMNKIRRTLCQSVGGFLGLLSLGACSQPAAQKPQQVYTEDEKQRLHKFREVDGFSLRVDLYPKRPSSSRGLYCKIVDEHGLHIAGGVGIETTRGGIPPVAINASLYDNTDANWKDKQPVLIGQWTVPVADRIPDDLLDDLRRDPRGNLRIKIRLHREGVLLGWDIERRPGYDPKKRDQWGNPIYVDPVYSFFGGDFREAEIFNGKAVRKGWYIHPRTKARIETDY
jgi:hypothetical protein